METIKKLKFKKSGISFGSFGRMIPVVALLFLQTYSFSQNQACLECHEDIVEKKFIHGPVDVDCTFCHESTGEKHPIENVKGFTVAQEGSDLCYTCHTEHQMANESNKYGHDAVVNGSCQDCHETHSSDDPKFLSSKVPEICNMCHYQIEEDVAGLAAVHSPVKDENGCVLCHNPHSSGESKLLVSNERALCLNCHNKTIMSGNRKIANINKTLSEGKMLHSPIEDGCIVCHNPHASATSKLLIMTYPAGNYAVGNAENYELCFTCHDSESLTEKTTKTATSFRNGDLNLHYLHVNKAKGRTCNNCHSVHGSLRDHLIAETVKFGKWDMPLNYNSTDNGGSCSTGCHKDWKYDRTKTAQLGFD